MDIGTVVQNVSMFTVGVVVVGFLAKILLSQFLSKDMERFKTRLSTEHAVEIERFRSDVRLAAFQRETRFASLHQKRAEVVAYLYKLLVGTERSAQSLISPVKWTPSSGQR